jgi:hypothetical protein
MCMYFCACTMHMCCSPSGVVSTATSAVSMVVSSQEKARCVIGLAKHKSIVTVKHISAIQVGHIIPLAKQLTLV